MIKTRLLLVIIALQFIICNLVYANPIRLHPYNKHYFLFRGEPTILITTGEHYGSVLNLDFDYIKYLNTLKSSGLNYTRIFTGTHVEYSGFFSIGFFGLAPAKGSAIFAWGRSNVPGYIGGGNKFDFEKWNPEYFNKLKDFISEAGKRGIIVEVTLFSSIYKENLWRYNPLNPSNNVNDIEQLNYKDIHTLNNGKILQYQENLVRKIVRELNDYDNIFYEIQNEPYADQTCDTTQAYILNPYDAESLDSWLKRADFATEASLEWQKHIASIIKDTESGLKYEHLIAQNYCNFYYPVRIKELSPDISIINFHYAWPEAVYLNYGLDKVISFDESGFSGKKDETYRKQAWNFILAGGGVFNHLDYSFAVGNEDGTFQGYTSATPGGGSPNLRSQIKVLKDFMYSFDFVKLKPDIMLVKKAPGVFTRVLAEIGKQYAIYIDGGEKCDLELELPEGNYIVDWVSTKNGNIEKTETVSHTGGSVTLISPIYNEDIAVRIKKYTR